jgi:hypothetical protein
MPRPTIALAAAALALALAAAACGGGGPTKSAASSSTTSTPTAGSTPDRLRAPGVFGSVAEVVASGSYMEVQGTNGQTTVSWTSTTRFDQLEAATEADLAPGRCVTVLGANTAGTLTATSVTITSPSPAGTCPTGALGGPGGAFGFGGGSGVAGGSSGGSSPGSAGPGTGGTRRTRAPGSFASGQVVSLSGDSLVILGHSGSGFRRAAGAGSSTTATTTPATDLTITLTSSTTYTQDVTLAPSDLAVGDCVVATGSTASNGSVTARRIRVTSTGGQSCTAGFGRFRPGGGGTGPGGGPSAESNSAGAPASAGATPGRNIVG